MPNSARKLKGKTPTPGKPVTKEVVAHRVSQLADSLGKRIDRGILPLVIELQQFGFTTTASCEGHSNRGEPAPWIDIGKQIPTDSLNRPSPRPLLARNSLQQRKLLALLDSYYLHRSVPADQRLVIIPCGIFGSFRMISQGAQIQQSYARPILRRNLLRYRREMQDFAEFLNTRHMKYKARTPRPTGGMSAG